jgi:hypothetical protein
MSLSEDWVSIFFDNNNRRDLLLDKEAKELISLLKQKTERPQLSIALACFDLLANVRADDYEFLMRAAKQEWPDYEWSCIIHYAVIFFLSMIDEGVDPEKSKEVAFKSLAYFFN